MSKKYILRFVFYYFLITVYLESVLIFIFEGNDLCYSEYSEYSSYEQVSILVQVVRYAISAVVETIVFSFLILFVLNKFVTQNMSSIIISISAIPFALAHYKCFNYIVVAYFAGILLNTYYSKMYEDTKRHSFSIVYLSILHFSVNVTTYILNVYYLL